MNDQTGKAVQLLSWFVVRARRVEQHSLALDKNRLLRWACGAMTAKSVNGQIISVQWDLPGEEPLESLAARCRPFLLPSDDLGWAKVIAALKVILEEREVIVDFQAKLDAIGASWRGLDRHDPAPLGYQSRAGANGNELGQFFNDRELAYAWLYGDLIHADDRMPERVGDHDINGRLRAASILIARTAYCVIVTLQLIRQIQMRHDLALQANALTRRVVARPSDELTVTQYAQGPAGTPAAELEALLSMTRTGSTAPDTRSLHSRP